MSFLHGAILFGFVALIIPPIVHLLNRRRFVVVDWAAMQFLQISKKTRQKVLLEQILLMLLRVLLIAALVLAVASPVIRLSCIESLPGGQRLAKLAGTSNRDIVIIVDGSFSMDYKWNNGTAHDAARDWSLEFLKRLQKGDQVAILQAKQRPIPVLDLLTAEMGEVRTKLESMPRPRGGVDWAKAVQEAQRILDDGRGSQKEIIILTDGQRHGWSDPRSLESWQLLALSTPKSQSSRIWVVNVVPDRPEDAPNWFLSPITANRSVATVDREVLFKFDLLSAFKVKDEKESPEAPAKIEFRVDDEPAGEKRIPRSREPLIGMDYRRSFHTVGSHLFSAIISEDALPGDNRRDFAIDVLPTIPVLIVDGEKPGVISPRGSDYLRFAIAPANLAQPSFMVKTIALTEFGSQTLTSPIAGDAWTLPRLLILQNVASLNDSQSRAIEEMLQRGGGVFVLLGPKCNAESWNGATFRNGEGWLPARLAAIAGDDDPKKGALPVASSVEKTFLDLFKEPDAESFAKSSFGHWWRLDTSAPGAGNVAAQFTSGDPLLVEKSFGKGRVLLSAVPLDDSWPTTLLRSHDFVRLCHECLYHLAAVRAAEVNLEARQPIVFRPADGEPPGGIEITRPDGSKKRVEVSQWPLVYEDTRETGVYKLMTDSGRMQYYVVQPDGGESVLTAATDADRRAVASLFPQGTITYESDRDAIVRAFQQGRNDPELWWLFLILVIVLLAAETAYARYLVKKNPPMMD